MKAKGSHALAVALIGLGLAAVSGAAYAEGNTAMQHAEMRKACTEQGGRFEQSWRYNDQGVHWGRVLSCSTSVGVVTCQDKVCLSRRWGRTHDVTAAASGPDGNDSTVISSTDPVAFISTFVALAEK